jgi:hypothetical protein
MATAQTPFAVPNKVATGGAAVTIMRGPILGGRIWNPISASDQGTVEPEVLYVDIVGPASLGESATTAPIQPGASFAVPALGVGSDVSVNAATSGHRFAAFVLQPVPAPPTPQSGTFPPAGPTTLTSVIPAYVYQQYADDDSIQAWFQALNAYQQSYVTWFATISLPVYTLQTGSLLDLVAAGIYGTVRPQLSSGQNTYIGPLNTYAFNTMAPNEYRRVGPSNVTTTSDDLFKRIITWNFYKGDGNTFNVRWLKRRVMRFLLGTDGSAPNIDQTYPVGVSLAPPNAISIRISVGTRTVIGGAMGNRFGPNEAGIALNQLLTNFVSPPDPLPYEQQFKEAMDAGVLTMPFQYEVTVVV